MIRTRTRIRCGYWDSSKIGIIQAALTRKGEHPVALSSDSAPAPKAAVFLNCGAADFRTIFGVAEKISRCGATVFLDRLAGEATKSCTYTMH